MSVLILSGTVHIYTCLSTVSEGAMFHDKPAFCVHNQDLKRFYQKKKKGSCVRNSLLASRESGLRNCLRRVLTTEDGRSNAPLDSGAHSTAAACAPHFCCAAPTICVNMTGCQG